MTFSPSALGSLSPAGLSILSGSSVGVSGQNPAGLTISPVLTVPPSTSPTPTPEPTPEPTVTVTVTSSPVPSSPAVVSIDPEQYTGLTVGLVLCVLFLAAVLVAQLRRP